MNELAWQESALCAGTDVDRWYPGRGEGVDQDLREMCAACPVWKACRDWALRHENYGFWAGTSEKQRRLIRSRTGIRLVELEPAPDIITHTETETETEIELEESA